MISIGCAFIAMLLIFYFWKPNDISKYFKIKHIIIVSFYQWGVSLSFGTLIFLLLYIFNGYNSRYLFTFKGYTDIELTDIRLYDEYGDSYKFMLTYDGGEQLKGVLIIEDAIPFKTAGDYYFYLTDIQGKVVYSSTFLNGNISDGYDLYTDFISSNFTQVEIDEKTK